MRGETCRWNSCGIKYRRLAQASNGGQEEGRSLRLLWRLHWLAALLPQQPKISDHRNSPLLDCGHLTLLCGHLSRQCLTQVQTGCHVLQAMRNGCETGKLLCSFCECLLRADTQGLLQSNPTYLDGIQMDEVLPLCLRQH